jgi:hypothetical protein
LQLIGAQLVDQTDAAPFLRQIEQDTGSSLADLGDGAAQLVAAVAAQRAQQIAGETFGMQAGQHRLGGVGLADDDGQMFDAAIGRAERDDAGVLGIDQRHARFRHLAQRSGRRLLVFLDGADIDHHQSRHQQGTGGRYRHQRRRQQPGQLGQRHRGGRNRAGGHRLHGHARQIRLRHVAGDRVGQPGHAHRGQPVGNIDAGGRRRDRVAQHGGAAIAEDQARPGAGQGGQLRQAVGGRRLGGQGIGHPSIRPAHRHHRAAPQLGDGAIDGDQRRWRGLVGTGRNVKRLRHGSFTGLWCWHHSGFHPPEKGPAIPAGRLLVYIWAHEAHTLDLAGG